MSDPGMSFLNYLLDQQMQLDLNRENYRLQQQREAREAERAEQREEVVRPSSPQTGRTGRG